MKNKMFIQIIYSFIFYELVISFPVKDKYSISGKMQYIDDKNVVESSIRGKHLPLEVSKLKVLPVEHFLRQKFSDIFNSTEQRASKMPRGKSSVSTAKNKERPSVNSKVSSQKVHSLPVNLQISPALQATRKTVTGRGLTGTGVDVKGKNTHLSSSHQRDADFLKSQPDPAVNHDSLPRKQAVHAELKVQPEKSDSVLVYEAKGRENTNGVAKAEALVTNLQEANPRQTSTMILIISSSFVVLLVTCVTVSIFQCCCRKKRNNEELQPPVAETKEEVDNTALLRNRSSIHDTPTYRPLSINSTGDGLVEEVPQLSVRDKIKAFEGQSKPDQENKTSTTEHGKPVRKRPKSKAFEEFENQGIIIGMGMVKPGRPKSTIETDADTSTEPGLLNEIMASMSSDYNNITMLSDTSDKILQNGSYTTPDTEMSSSYVDEDLDEFSGVERNTHILRSFKRAPPPKNRSRSKRSSRRRLPLQDATNLSNDTTDAPNGFADTGTEKPESYNLDEQTPTDTSVQRVWNDLGSPSIHSSESRTDIDKTDTTETTTNQNRSVINGHTPSITNGHSQREGGSRSSDREATPPDKSTANGNHETSKPPHTMKMYENPCYESIDVIQASINRVSTVEKSSNGSRTSPDKSELSGLARTDKRTPPPRTDIKSSPPRDDDRAPRPKSRTRISPESHTSPDRSEQRVSPPKHTTRTSPSRSDKRQSWKESPSNGTEPMKPLKQTHL